MNRNPKGLFPADKDSEKTKAEVLKLIQDAREKTHFDDLGIMFHFIIYSDMHHLESAWYLINDIYNSINPVITEDMGSAWFALGDHRAYTLTARELDLARAFLFNQLSVLNNRPGLHRLGLFYLKKSLSDWERRPAILSRLNTILSNLHQYQTEAMFLKYSFQHPLYDFAWSQILMPTIEAFIDAGDGEMALILLDWSRFYLNRAKNLDTIKKIQLETNQNHLLKKMDSLRFSAPAQIPLHSVMRGILYDVHKIRPEFEKIETQLPVRSSITSGYCTIEIPEINTQSQIPGSST